MIFYALVGIPVHAILFAYMGEFWGKSFEKLYNRYKRYKMSTNRNWVPPKLSLIGQITLYLFPAMIIFIFFPAMLFTYFEGWDYTISIYYSFVTLTTIGFGDYVPTFQPHQERTFGIYFVFYQLFILVWFITGLGYLVMIIGFLIKGLRSKRIKRIEHNLALNIKETQKKIWNGVTKDVGYIRKVLNEVYFLKFKPVYIDPEETMRQFQIPKSQSCPNLFMDEDDEEEERIIPHIKHRERAVSECVRRPGQKRLRSISASTLNRVHSHFSDSNLSYIDKEKTFANDSRRSTSVQPGELLKNLVVALGGFRLGDEEEQRQSSRHNSMHNSIMGIHGFSDSQILASEQNYNSNWSIGASEKSYATSTYNPNQRSRANSEVRIPIESVKASTEWTWSGANTQISEIEKMRSRAAKPKENLYKTSLQTKLRYDSETVDDFPRDLPLKPDAEATNKSLLSKLNPFKKKSQPLPSMMKRHSLAPGQELDLQKYLRNTQDGRASVSSLSKNYLTQPRPSMFTLPCFAEEQDLLETTTIADLIRAIEQVHTESAVPSTSQESLKSKNGKRKLGTDHLTPPQSLLTLSGNFQSSHTIHGPSSDFGSLKASGRNRLHSLAGTPAENRARILGDANPFARRLSMRPPPPYSPSTTPPDSLKPTLKRRFSVRPSNLDLAPGQFHNPKNLQVTAPSQPAINSTTMPFQSKITWHPQTSSLAKPNKDAKNIRKQSESTSSTKPS